MAGLMPEGSVRNQPLDADEKAWTEATNKRRARETGYQQIQGTKPQTLSYGLTDSPTGLAAWILEKFHGWTIPGRDAPPPFDRDHLLANIMLYWLAGPNAASWLYCSLIDGSARRPPEGRSRHGADRDAVNAQRSRRSAPDPLAGARVNLIHRRDAEDGGHFPAFEKPELFVEEVRGFFRKFRG